MTEIPDIIFAEMYIYAEHKCGMVKQQMQAIVTNKSVLLKCMKCQGKILYRRVQNI